jgi:hypothetical protein
MNVKGILLSGLLLLLLLLSASATASHIQLLTITPGSTAPGAITTYTIEFQIGGGNGNLAAGDPKIRVIFPADYGVASTTFDSAASGVREGNAVAYSAFPAFAGFTADAGTRTLRISDINYATVNNSTMFRVVFPGVQNPSTGGLKNIQVSVLNASDGINTNGAANVGIDAAIQVIPITDTWALLLILLGVMAMGWHGLASRR